jgi:hypothetical protein
MIASFACEKELNLKLTSNPTTELKVDSQQEDDEERFGNVVGKRKKEQSNEMTITSVIKSHPAGYKRPRFLNLYELASYCGMYTNAKVLQLFHFPSELPRYWRDFLNKKRKQFMDLSRDEFELATRHLGRKMHKNSLGILLTKKLISIIMPCLVQNTLYNFSCVPLRDSRIIKFTLEFIQLIIDNMLKTATHEEREGMKEFVVFDKSACSSLMKKLNVTLTSYIFNGPRQSKVFNNNPDDKKMMEEGEVYLLQTPMALDNPSLYPSFGYTQAEVLFAKSGHTKDTKNKMKENIALLRYVLKYMFW